MNRALATLLTLALLAALTVFGEEPPIAVEDVAADGVLLPETLWDWTFTADVDISRDGRRVAYVVTEVDKARDTYRSDIWVHDLETGEARPFTSHPALDLVPRFSPDGRRLAFVSARVSPPQLFVLDLGGGEARQLTDLDGGVAEIAWSPDGRRIAFTSDALLPAEKQRHERREKKELADRNARRGDTIEATAPREHVLDQFQIRRDGRPGYLDENVRYRHVWVVDVPPPPRGPLPARRPAPPAVERLTQGPFDDTAPTWSADARSLVFAALRKRSAARGGGGSVGLIYNDSDLFRVGVPDVLDATRDGSPPQPLVADSDAAMLPLVSPDGEWIAFLSMPLQEPLPSHVMFQLAVVRADGSEKRVLAEDLDRSIGRAALHDVGSPTGGGRVLAWDPDSSSIYATVLDDGRTPLYRFGLDGSWEELTHLDGDLREVAVAMDGRGKRTFVTVASTSTEPYDVWAFTTANGAAAQSWRRLTHWNVDLLSSYRIDPYEEVRFASFDGLEIQGFLLKPPGFANEKRYPLVLYIHGGPHTMYGMSFFHEMHVLAHQGYVVLFVNPRGSAGFGFEFGNMIQFKYPGDDARDLLAAVDHVVERGRVDPERLGVTGGSAGGLLTNWLLTQTDRFAAAVAQRSTSDFTSAVGTSDIGPLKMRIFFHGLPWQTPGHYQKLSPLSYADRITTPLLLIHSENDYRVPIEQAFELYTALKVQDKTVELVVFPEASHALSRSGRPSQRVARLRHILRWFEAYLK